MAATTMPGPGFRLDRCSSHSSSGGFCLVRSVIDPDRATTRGYCHRCGLRSGRLERAHLDVLPCVGKSFNAERGWPSSASVSVTANSGGKPPWSGSVRSLARGGDEPGTTLVFVRG